MNFKYDRGDKIICVERSYPWEKGEIYTINLRCYERGSPWYKIEGRPNSFGPDLTYYVMEENIMEPYEVNPIGIAHHIKKHEF